MLQDQHFLNIYIVGQITYWKTSKAHEVLNITFCIQIFVTPKTLFCILHLLFLKISIKWSEQTHKTVPDRLTRSISSVLDDPIKRNIFTIALPSCIYMETITQTKQTEHADLCITVGPCANDSIHIKCGKIWRVPGPAMRP